LARTPVREGRLSVRSFRHWRSGTGVAAKTRLIRIVLRSVETVMQAQP
jgi:hypothetical protein